MTIALAATQADRAAGVLLGLACGDALGAGYEFQAPRINGEPVAMVGGGPYPRPWGIGEWTDDTSMAIAIAETAATGVDLRSNDALDRITARFVEWSLDANDIGSQTSAVLTAVRADPTAAAAQQVAEQLFARRGSAGNGSLMRTGPVALAYLGDEPALMQAAAAVSSLTHTGPDAVEACQLWTSAIAHAVVYGTFDGLRLAVNRLPSDRAMYWRGHLDHAESVAPHEIANNGWVVAAVQAAWSAISRTPVPDDDPGAGQYPAAHFAHALDAAVRAGHDTDTVAAIAGSLLGARWGASAVPLEWRRVLHGWPGMRGRDLIRLGLLTARGGRPDSSGWPHAVVQDYSGYAFANTLTAHPHDDRVLLAGVGALHDPPAAVTAVVSLCRLGAGEVPARGIGAADHVEVWLADRADVTSNTNLDLVLTQAADTVASLRAAGHTVLLHCVEARSRTPTVAALYASRHLGVDAKTALRNVLGALPHADPNPGFRAALQRLTADGGEP